MKGAVMVHSRIYLSFLIVALVLSGCSGLGGESLSGEKAESKQESQEKQKEGVEIPEELKGIPLPPEGKYAGEKYDWSKVKKELDQIPKDANGKEILDKMYGLAAEDYTSYFRFFKSFDTSNIEVEEGPEGQGIKKLPEEKKVNVMILLDASGSMAEKVPGGVKMDLAKKAVKEFASQMPEGANVSLVAYGHKGSNSKKDQSVSCRGIEEVYSLGSYEENRFNQALEGFRPTGWTPLAASMEQAKAKLGSHAGAENIVYVVSDGMETCGGDPVGAARQLHQSNMKAVVNIIGFDVDNAGQEALKAVADAGGGDFNSVDSEADLDQYFAREKQRLEKEWARWGSENYDKAARMGNEKYDQIQDKANEMYDLATTEKERYDQMADYLEEERGFTWDFIFKQVKKKYGHRRDQLVRWGFDTAKELRNEALDNANQVKDEVLERSREERDKLSQ